MSHDEKLMIFSENKTAGKTKFNEKFIQFFDIFPSMMYIQIKFSSKNFIALSHHLNIFGSVGMKLWRLS
jgi:hypothetical protein